MPFDTEKIGENLNVRVKANIAGRRTAAVPTGSCGFLETAASEKWRLRHPDEATAPPYGGNVDLYEAAGRVKSPSRVSASVLGFVGSSLVTGTSVLARFGQPCIRARQRARAGALAGA